MTIRSFVSAATATCSIAGIDNTKTAALSVYDYLVNHPDEIPGPLSYDDVDSDMAVNMIKSYLDIKSPSTLTISYYDDDIVTCQLNWSKDIFDFLTAHFACLQTSHFMEVNWIISDGLGAARSGTNYYNKSNELIDIKSILNAHFAPATAGE